MKKIFSNVMLVAAAAMTFFGCQKPEMISPEISEEIMLTFGCEKPAFDDETKTEWNADEKTIHWSKGDKISVAYTVNDVWTGTYDEETETWSAPKLYKSNELEGAGLTAKFNVSTYFKGQTEGTHVFYGLYPAPSATSFDDAPVANVTIAPSQNPKADSFDSNGDLMIGVSEECDSRPDKNDVISLMWERLVAHAVISLKNINGLTEGEEIENITLTAQDDANLVGQQKVNLLTKEVVKDNDAANVLKIGASNLAVKDGVLTFWACFLPEKITSLAVMVETDKAYYTRKISSCDLTFKQNARNVLSIMMDEAEREEKVVASDEVVDVLTKGITGATTTTYVEWSGKKLISEAVYAGNSAGGNNSIQLRSDKSSAGVVTTTSGGFAKKIVVKWNSNTANGRTLDVYGKSSAYSAPTDLYNNASQGTKIGSIVCGTSTELTIDGEYEYIGLRSKSGAMYIEEIQITWSTAAAVPDSTPSVELETEVLELTAEESEGTIEVVAKNIASIEVRALAEEGSKDDSEWLVAEFDEENSCVTYSASANESEEERTAYIEVYCLDAEGNEVVAGVNVTQAGFVDESDLPIGIASIYDVVKVVNTTSSAPSPLDEFTVSINDAIVTYVNGSSAFVEDATAGILIYKSGHGFAAGDKLNGVLSGKGYVRYGVCQITEFDMTNITKETDATIPCAEVTITDLLNNYASYVSRRVKIVDAAVTDGVTGSSDKNGVVRQNGSSVNLYNNTSVNFVETEVVDFYAYPSYYNTTKQLATWEAPITKKVATPIIACASNVVTISCGTTGASVYYAIGEGEYAAYTAGIEIDETVTVKAYATKSGLVDSEVASQECEYVEMGSQPVTVDATLSFANKAQRTSFSSTQQVWEQNGIKFTNDKSSSTNAVADYAAPVRLYANSKVTIAAPGNITKIVFDANSSSYATAMKNSIGTVSGATVSVSSDKVTVTFANANAASFVVAKLSAQVRMDSITVTYLQ